MKNLLIFTNLFLTIILAPNVCFASRGDGILLFLPLLTFVPSLVLTLIVGIVQFFRARFLQAFLRFVLCLVLQVICPAIFFGFLHTSFAQKQSLVFCGGITILAALIGGVSVWVLVNAPKK
ncbi:MAG: hypothetical protein R3A13_09115 [Bdellovibrionota bacterium]